MAKGVRASGTRQGGGGKRLCYAPLFFGGGGMAKILVDGVPTEVGDKPITLLAHKGDVHLAPTDQVEIGPEQTLARASQVTDAEWVALMQDATFVELAESVLGAGSFPMVPRLKDCGTGTRHITGMILLFSELNGRQPYVRYPESFLHPLSQTRLAQLLIRLSGAGK